MKKCVIVMLITVFISGMAFAQERGERQRINPPVGRQRIEPLEVHLIEGILKLERGIVAVQSGETIYLVPILNRYIGFINDLREDARVSIEGYVTRNTIHPVKAVIGERAYDFSPMMGMQFFNFGNMRNFDNMMMPLQRQRLDLEELRQRLDTERENLRRNFEELRQRRDTERENRRMRQRRNSSES